MGIESGVLGQTGDSGDDASAEAAAEPGRGVWVPAYGYRTEAKIVLDSLGHKSAELCGPGDRDLREARRLLRAGRNSRHVRNRLMAAKIEMAICECERRHARWAEDFAQRERQAAASNGLNAARLDIAGQQASNTKRFIVEFQAKDLPHLPRVVAEGVSQAASQECASNEQQH